LTRKCESQIWNWEERDSILYSLCMGLGTDPGDDRTLPYVCEKGDLKVVPTMPTVLAWIAKPTFEELGISPVVALHGEQKIELYQSVTIPSTVNVRGRVVSVYDQGAGRGALITTEQSIFNVRDDALVALLTTTCFARGEGGFGGPETRPPVAHVLPERLPDRSVDLATRADHALLYRLTGDRNFIHSDPKFAKAAGFDRPILHGLCSFGITCRAVLENFVDFDAARIASHQARFTAPVIPGETMSIDLWRDEDVISFRARIRERNNVVVISNGKCVLRN
jgi:acyl dehydratase